MRILMTNHSLEQRGGAQLYLMEMANALRERGHQLAAYSTRVGQVADLLKAASIPVIADPWDCPWQPEIIHGQHALETMAAITAFPDTPAVFHCHGFIAWRQWPIVHPRVMRYITIGKVLETRLMTQQSIPEHRIDFLPNFVALDHFPKRPPLPERPQKALIFGNNFEDKETHRIFREACAEAGITKVDGLGRPFDRMSDKPGPILAEYDVVFARGRAAMEAAAVGCAVILTDNNRKCALLTTRNFHELRERNFSQMSSAGPLVKEQLAEVLSNYDATDAAGVCQLIHDLCSLEGSAAGIEEIHKAAVAEWNQLVTTGQRPSLEEEKMAEAKYLRHLVPIVKDLEGRWVEEFEARQDRDAKVRELEKKLKAEREKNAKLAKKVGDLERKKRWPWQRIKA